jgi:hypothetical protein
MIPTDLSKDSVTSANGVIGASSILRPGTDIMRKNFRLSLNNLTSYQVGFRTRPVKGECEKLPRKSEYAPSLHLVGAIYKTRDE